MAPQERIKASTQHAPDPAAQARESWLDQLVRGLSTTLGARYGMLGELTEHRSIRVRALSGYPVAHAPLELSLAGSPAERLGQDDLFHCPQGARQLFPDDSLLRCLQAESYLGVPLRGLAGQPIGVLAALHDEPLELVDEQRETLMLFATRASSELQRQQYEEQLMESERRYRCIVSTCPEGIWWLDVQGKTTFVNSSMASLLGYQPSELLGMPFTQLLHAGERSWRIQDLLAQQDGAAVPPEIRLRTRDGAEVCTLITTRLVRDGDGRLSGVLAFVTDVTERRALEQRALHSQKLQSIGLLAGGVAHDFNNILLGILGRAEIARSHLQEDHPSAESLRGIEKAVEHAADLTQQLLAYAGKSRVRAKVIELGSVVDEMTTLLGTVISKKAQIKVKHAAPAHVSADPSQISQVVMNLIINAGEALEQQPGTIEVETGICHADKRMLSSMYVDDSLAEGTYAYLTVKDSGRGMDAATRERIFEPFFSKKTSGRGLGLAAVIGILRLHRGAVRVVSEPGQGAAFTVLLPQADEHEREASIPPPPPRKAVAPPRGLVLVADDEPIAREISKTFLEKAGYQVLLAADGEQALRCFLEHKHELCAVVLDRSMPELSGEQVYVEIIRERPTMPVVVSSGYAEQDMLELFQSEAPLKFLLKPWRGADLLRALQEILSGEQTRQA